MKVVTLTEAHLEAAAGLLAERHRAHRAVIAALPAEPEAPGEARKILGHLWKRPRTSGVAAMEGERLVGFLLGSLKIETLWGRTGWIYAAGHAVSPAAGAELYRDLYAALAERWVEVGCFAHFAMIPATDTAVLQAFFSLSFGQEQVHAFRPVHPANVALTPGADSIEVRRATLEDLPLCVKLTGITGPHMSRSPVFAAFLPESPEDWPKDYDELLHDDANRIWLAFHEGQPVGLLLASPAGRGADDVITPDGSIGIDLAATEPAYQGRGIGRKLLARALEDAHQLGYRWVVSDWRAANLVSSRFWPRFGFTPMVYRLSRRIDERIAWARG